MDNGTVIAAIDFFKTINTSFGDILNGVRGLFHTVVEISTETSTIDDDTSILYVMNSSSPQTISVPADLGEISIGSAIAILQKGTGSVTIQAAEGVTIFKSSSTLTISEQYKTIQLIKIAPNEWVAIGSFD